MSQADSLPDEVRERFQAALRRFAAECFWNCDLQRGVTSRAAAREVIRRLRLHGGRSGWQAAAELVRCL